MEDIALVALVTPFVVGAIQVLKFLNLPYRLWRPTALFVGGLVFLVPVNVKRGREAAMEV